MTSDHIKGQFESISKRNPEATSKSIHTTTKNKGKKGRIVNSQDAQDYTKISTVGLKNQNHHKKHLSSTRGPYYGDMYVS